MQVHRLTAGVSFRAKGLPRLCHILYFFRKGPLPVSFCGPSPCPFIQPAGIGTWLRRAVCILHQFETGRNKPWGLILNCNGDRSQELFAIQLRADVWKLGVNLLYLKECFGLCSLRREDILWFKCIRSSQHP